MVKDGDIQRAIDAEVQKKCAKQNEKWTTMHSELKYWKLKSETLIDVCSRMNTEIVDLTTRIENLELTNSKKMVIVTGFTFMTEKKWEQTDELRNLFESSMGLQINIEEHYMLGQAIVIVLQTYDEKRQLMRFKSALKNYRSSAGKNIFVNDYYPPTTQEKKRREM